tara:strand:+ start:3850 stop:6660 length:2811 start_codon:yes stop_codon:yes gene_type:complete
MEISDPKLKELRESLDLTDEIIQRYVDVADSAQEKIFHKFKEATEGEFYKRRWFWELLQNAADTVEEGQKVQVKITISSISNELAPKSSFSVIFEHNGGAFKPAIVWNKRDEFKSFILAKSGKFSDDDKVGKFGTGFLSTHCLSDRITIEGKCKENNGRIVYRKIDLDRAEFSEETTYAQGARTLKIIKALDEYEQTAKSYVEEDFSARYSYHCENNGFEIAKAGIEDLKFSLPYVFSFNSKIETVTIYDKSNEVEKVVKYLNQGFIDKHGYKLHTTRITINDIDDTLVNVACLNNDFCTLAWKVEQININGKEYLKFINERKSYNDSFEIEMDSLYCQFPLIGSYRFKFPVIINSKSFRPSEKRHGINLKEGNQTNKNIIESAIELYKAYLSLALNSGLNLFNIIDTLYVDLLPEWIDNEWYKHKIDELRNHIKLQQLVDVNEENQQPKSFVNTAGECQTDFPVIRVDSRDLNIKLYDFVSKVDQFRLPKRDHLQNWLKVIWKDDKDISRINAKTFLTQFAGNAKYDSLVNSIEPESVQENEDYFIGWLKKLYSFITDDLDDVNLFETDDNTTKNGIILTRGKDFKPLRSLKKEVGFEGAKIDSELITIHNEYYPNKDNIESTIIHSEFAYLIDDNRDLKEEKQIAEKIKSKAEELLSKHEEILKDNSNHHIQEKNEIEGKLSMLQDWISKHNTTRNYFDLYTKRRILQAIIDEKKSIHLTKLLELDRGGKRSIEEQARILSDKDLDEKLKLGTQLLDSIRDKENKDERNRAIGTHFENLFQSLMADLKIPCRKVDGEQDFVLNEGQYNEKFIELKSIQSGRNTVKISPEQAAKSIEKKANYYLCIIPYSGNFEIIDKGEFIRISRFTNQLYNLVFNKNQMISEFRRQVNGINGKLVDKKIVQQFREKQYMIEIDRNKIFTRSFYEIKNNLKLNV